MARIHVNFDEYGVTTSRPYTPEEELEADRIEEEYSKYILQKDILDAILQIEETITNRRLREALLTTEGADWLSQKEQEITILRASL